MRIAFNSFRFNFSAAMQKNSAMQQSLNITKTKHFILYTILNIIKAVVAPFKRKFSCKYS